MEALVHSLNIRSNSWHARWYRHWLSLGGQAPAYKENLCHYMRVLLIWAPLRWLLMGRIRKVLPPWVAAIVTGFLAFVGVAIYLWPDASLTVLWKTAAALGSLFGAIGLILGVVYLYDHDPETTKKVAVWITLPLWIVPLALFLVGRMIWRRFESELRFFGKWFFESDSFGIGPPPVLVILTLGFLAALGGLFYENWLKTLIVIAAMVGGALALLGLLIAVTVFDDHRKKQRLEPATVPSALRTRIGRAVEGTADTVKLGATYVATKKRGSRFCPFISFGDGKAA